MSAKCISAKYELVVIFDPGLSDSDVEQELGKIAQLAISYSGKIDRRDIWGRRQLAYPMRKRRSGIYVVLVVIGDTAMVADLRRQLKINDNVLRVLIVEKDQYAPDFRPELREEAPAAAPATRKPATASGPDESSVEKDAPVTEDATSEVAKESSEVAKESELDPGAVIAEGGTEEKATDGIVTSS